MCLFSEWWDLKNPDEKNDVLPEIINGKNIADYIDPDIFKNLEALEKEEELREEAGFYDDDEVCVLLIKSFIMRISYSLL